MRGGAQAHAKEIDGNWLNKECVTCRVFPLTRVLTDAVIVNTFWDTQNNKLFLIENLHIPMCEEYENFHQINHGGFIYTGANTFSAWSIFLLCIA